MLARDVMKSEVIAVSKETTIEEIARLMVENKISGFPVVDEENRVLGVVSEMDLMRQEIKPNEPNVWQVCLWGINSDQKLGEYQDSMRKWMAQNAGEIMTSPAISVDESDDLDTVGQLMFERRIKRVVVTRQGKLAGIISRSAFVKRLVQR